MTDLNAFFSRALACFDLSLPRAPCRAARPDAFAIRPPTTILWPVAPKLAPAPAIAAPAAGLAKPTTGAAALITGAALVAILPKLVDTLPALVSTLPVPKVIFLPPRETFRIAFLILKAIVIYILRKHIFILTFLEHPSSRLSSRAAGTAPLR